MTFPFVVDKGLSQEELDTWNRVFLPTKGNISHDLCVEESLWRRTQSERNKKVSGWTSPEDKSRKILYYRHLFDIVTDNSTPILMLTGSIVYISLTLRTKELQEYHKVLLESIKTGGWESYRKNNAFQNGDLVMKYTLYSNPCDNPFEYNEYTTDYETLEVIVQSKNFVFSHDTMKMIWSATKSGLRQSLVRGNPKYSDSMDDLIQHLPAQIELGCGPAYEVGVPPLHTLHETYSINEPFTKKFIIDAQEDVFFRSIIENPEVTYTHMTNFYKQLLAAPLGSFYITLKKLYDMDLFVGPIITNNFDGIHLRLGIPETFLRSYLESRISPKIEFDPRAKSLLVIGCHADRRNVERCAREHGLKVFFFDPEGWWVSDQFIQYPLESPQDDDVIYKQTATTAIAQLYRTLLKNQQVSP